MSTQSDDVEIVIEPPKRQKGSIIESQQASIRILPNYNRLPEQDRTKRLKESTESKSDMSLILQESRDKKIVVPVAVLETRNDSINSDSQMDVR